jgi:hypothetical protein
MTVGSIAFKASRPITKRAQMVHKLMVVKRSGRLNEIFLFRILVQYFSRCGVAIKK